MKLLNSKYCFSFDFDNDSINELVCENPSIYNELIIELYSGFDEKCSTFVLSQNSELIEFDKYCEIIFNPFQVNVNNKKNLEKLYVKLLKAIDENGLYMEKISIITNIIEFINKLSFLSNCNINFVEDIDFRSFFKITDVKLEGNDDNFVESLCNYMKVSNELQGEKIYIFINLKSFITLEQIKELYKNAIYNKFKIVLLENVDRKLIESEIKIIIDRDGCIIA